VERGRNAGTSVSLAMRSAAWPVAGIKDGRMNQRMAIDRQQDDRPGTRSRHGVDVGVRAGVHGVRGCDAASPRSGW
jgi:hypothetical protein